ncbi:Phospholipid metabolism protein [Saitoella coloradoensis]|uniref:PRELI/MSF1 domain-containing protein n=1 Tax=Saitoella complicata (strain BCRC 22490 / CBS 7301 / JCM 7358 / NBRC 10748 / NRRL Y-17804) TaxID=698492 RepID=A0A0E9NFU9_SAICN|nr:MSF1-domain-containing protein [Saitoella complicata NRRL Y-17804]ODQ54225.1 MSF1-domain-containing protein [Saitoella complicata NRRL Y-17804]GAO48561.1 hypothetical protein G7K_2734-t1 [Saitoella complicata NRRL Y-17804]
MKIFENTCVFDHPWNMVSAANWRKYPNEFSSHVISVDTLRREVDPSTGVLRSERIIACKQSAPRWILRLIGGDEISFVREVSEVDPKSQTVVMRSVNLTFANILSVQETVKYHPDPESPAKTIFEQNANISAYGPLQRLENFTVDRFSQNATKGRKGFEEVLEKVSQMHFWKDEGKRQAQAAFASA